MKQLNLITGLFLFCSLLSNIHAQERITRGFAPGEIYISSMWYEPVYGEERYDAIFFSDDNGKTLSIRYVCDVYSFEDMQVAYLLRDSTPGVIYNYYRKTLHRSDDYGFTWKELKPTGNYTNQYAAGCTAGEIYLVHSLTDNTGISLERSIDYGESFALVNNKLLTASPEVGTQPGEIYLRDAPSSGDSLRIYFSNNSGTNFTKQCALDTSIAGHVPGGHYPKLSRGTSPGELYLVTWHDPMNFHVHYSSDYGKSFETRYTSEEFNWFYIYSFSAGVESGSFYMEYFIPYYDGINTMLYIYYSSDTAKTFTVYSHLLDENVAVNEYKPVLSKNLSLKCVPNPNTGLVTFNFLLEYRAKVEIGIYNTNGKYIDRIEKQWLKQGVHSIEYNGRKLKPGVYIIILKVNGKAVETNKLLKL